jgi:methylamine dehydrogenase heavy chain
MAMVLLGCVSSAGAEFQPEAVGKVETLPARYPEHWVMVHDVSFFHMFEGEVVVVDPLATTVGDQYKGMMPASFIAAYRRGRERNEHYVVETFYSRGGRGGTRTDVVTIYDPATLKVAAEIEIPAKRVTGMPKALMTGFIGGERLLGVYNFTPAQSVTIVDLAERKFVTEVPTPGCGFILPNGKSSFTSICSNGSLLTTHLDAAGHAQGSNKTKVLFDAENDPVFESAAVVDGVAYFPTFSGQVLPIDLKGEEVKAGNVWLLTAEDGAGWRPGGMIPVMADSAGTAYFLMHPEGGEGTHKDGGSEVWVYDLQPGKPGRRSGRIKLENWGLSMGTSGTGEGRLMFVTNTEMGVDVYRIPQGEFVHTLQTGAATPFMVHGAH